MDIIIIILFAFIFSSSIIINCTLYLILGETRDELNLANNAVGLWLKSEVKMKRSFYKLSVSLEKDRDKQRYLLYSSYKKYNRLKRYIKSFIRGRITLDILINKFK